jgi:dGTPase
VEDVLRTHPQLQGRRLLYEAIRRMLSAQVYDVIDATREGLERTRPADVDAVRSLPPLVCFSAQMRERSLQLKTFLLRNLYRHPQVMENTGQARIVVEDLFDAYLAGPHEMHGVTPRADLPRAVADYIAGMTDRFAMREHARLRPAATPFPVSRP